MKNQPDIIDRTPQSLVIHFYFLPRVTANKEYRNQLVVALYQSQRKKHRQKIQAASQQESYTAPTEQSTGQYQN